MALTKSFHLVELLVTESAPIESEAVGGAVPRDETVTREVESRQPLPAMGVA